MDPLQKIQTGLKPLAKVAALFGILAGVGVGYWFIMDNLYKPKVEVSHVDYEKGVALLKVNGKERVLYDGSSISAGGHWGVRFAASDGKSPERVELVKNDLTHKILDISAVFNPKAAA